MHNSLSFGIKVWTRITENW